MVYERESFPLGFLKRNVSERVGFGEDELDSASSAESTRREGSLGWRTRKRRREMAETRRKAAATAARSRQRKEEEAAEVAVVVGW